MRDKPRRAKQQPEDKILGRVFNRLRNQLKVRYEDISEWSKTQEKYISVSCLCDMATGCATNYLSRIPIVAQYFREIHGLDYVTEGFLLKGTEEDQEWARKERELQKMIEEMVIRLPLEQLIDEQTA